MLKTATDTGQINMYLFDCACLGLVEVHVLHAQLDARIESHQVMSGPTWTWLLVSSGELGRLMSPVGLSKAAYDATRATSSPNQGEKERWRYTCDKIGDENF